MTFKGALRPEQQIAADQMLIYEDGIMSAPTGFGKTVIGAYLIAAIGLPTLVIVPKTALITQWKSQLERFVDITDNREPVRTPKGRISKKQPPLIGQIGGGKTAVSGLIDVASFQSLSGKDRQTGEPIVKDLVRNYGLIICDECRRAAARACSQVCPGQIRIRPFRNARALRRSYAGTLHALRPASLCHRSKNASDPAGHPAHRTASFYRNSTTGLRARCKLQSDSRPSVRAYGKK